MSLISDALKKAQQERTKQPREDEPLAPLEDTSPQKGFPAKRLIFYSAFLLVIVVVVLAVTIFFKPEQKSGMTALNIRKQQPASTPSQQLPPQQQSTPTETTEPGHVETQGAEPPKPEIKQETVPQPAEASPAKEKPKTVHQETPPTTQRKTKKTKPKQQPKTKAKKNNNISLPVPRKNKPKPKPAVKKVAPKVETPQPTNDSDTYLRQGDTHMESGNYPLAVEQYKKALEIEKTPGTYLKLYSAFKLMKNRVLARAYIEDGVANFPDDFYLNKLAALQNIRARRFRDSLRYAQAAIEKNDKDYATFTYLGLSYFHLGEYKNALKNFQASLQLNSDAIENYYYIGLIFDNQKQYKKALDYYTVFFKLNPENKNFKHHKWVTTRMKILKQYIGK